ncbi:M13 family metallopeptidase [Undibacterium sp. Dicai25W]|uniref:M13 family metallopeptidase n=1 Tax=Undibacterium sp. Dicai25W TaxID=3413034 RepID=UPI003BF365E1
MKAKVLSAIALMIAGTASTTHVYAAETAKAAAPSVLLSGIDSQYGDKSVKAQDDFYRHVNGGWLKTAQIPADRSSAGAFMDLREAVVPRLHTIIEGLSKAKNANGTDAQKISDLYASFMDTKHIESLGLKPLQSDFAKIDAFNDKKQLPALMAWMNINSINVPYDIQVHQDNKDSTKYVLDISQSGLSLPDRDYYLKDDDAKLKDTREKYLKHIEKMLTMAGDKDASKNASAILALETELAKIQWTKVELRDPIKAYNKVELSKLNEVTPGYDWDAYLSDLGVKGKIDYLIIGQPSYLTAMNKVLIATPIDTLKAYFKWNLLSSASGQLPKQFSEESFAFFGKILRGVPEQEIRWKRGVRLVDAGMGESLGKMYVDKYFPADSKAKMETLVNNLLLAYKNSVGTLDWMSPETKKEALSKLSTFMPKIGYPNKWKDYTSLQITKGDAVGNLRAIRSFAAKTELNKLGKPVDREEWGMTPQTVNAYYNPEMNEIVFPAAILQAPFFNPKADDAVNYGGIGAVIGHEISHGFDDQGAQYDGLGNLRDWWTKEDHEKFATKTAALVKQYSKFSPVPGYNVNGELTLGENIADNSGISIAYKAYQLSLGGKPAPVINGMTGDQRFFMGFAQVWRGKIREQEAIIRIKTDPHSPGEFRANGALQNMTPFYKAFDLKEGDKMYLPASERVSIW